MIGFSASVYLERIEDEELAGFITREFATRRPEVLGLWFSRQPIASYLAPEQVLQTGGDGFPLWTYVTARDLVRCLRELRDTKELAIDANDRRRGYLHAQHFDALIGRLDECPSDAVLIVEEWDQD